MGKSKAWLAKISYSNRVEPTQLIFPKAITIQQAKKQFHKLSAGGVVTHIKRLRKPLR